MLSQVGTDFVMNTASCWVGERAGIDTMVADVIGTDSSAQRALSLSVFAQGVKWAGHLADTVGLSWFPHSYQTPTSVSEFAYNVAVDAGVLFVGGEQMNDALNSVLPSDDSVSTALKTSAIITAADVVGGVVKGSGLTNFMQREMKIIY